MIQPIYPGKPVTEILMAKIPQQKRVTQLTLFHEHPVEPYWRDISEATRVETIRILSRLLLQVRAGRANRIAQDGEAR